MFLVPSNSFQWFFSQPKAISLNACDEQFSAKDLRRALHRYLGFPLHVLSSLALCLKTPPDFHLCPGFPLLAGQCGNFRKAVNSGNLSAHVVASLLSGITVLIAQCPFPWKLFFHVFWLLFICFRKNGKSNSILAREKSLLIFLKYTFSQPCKSIFTLWIEVYMYNLFVRLVNFYFLNIEFHQIKWNLSQFLTFKILDFFWNSQRLNSAFIIMSINMVWNRQILTEIWDSMHFICLLSS